MCTTCPDAAAKCIESPTRAKDTELEVIRRAADHAQERIARYHTIRRIIIYNCPQLAYEAWRIPLNTRNNKVRLILNT